MQLFIILALAGVVWFWWDSSGAREAAISAATQTCKKAGVQLLDFTVGLRKIRLQRDNQGQMKLARLYSFEFTQTGSLRNHGYVVMLGKHIFKIEIDIPDQDTRL